jgi:hypothetical protein
MKIEKYSFGMGDRFVHQSKAQLQAMVMAKEAGIEIAPVWKKSDREHVSWARKTVATRRLQGRRPDE